MTTTIYVYGVRTLPDTDPDADGFDVPATTPYLLVERLNASISGPTGSNVEGLEQEVWRLRCDQFELHRSDYVEDTTTGYMYSVRYVHQSEIDTPWNLNHTIAELVREEGLPSR